MEPDDPCANTGHFFPKNMYIPMINSHKIPGIIVGRVI